MEKVGRVRISTDDRSIDMPVEVLFDGYLAALVSRMNSYTPWHSRLSHKALYGLCLLWPARGWSI
jgi:hypothetical protein